MNPDIFLTPFTNSYGHILDEISAQIGFMKDSINIIYPKISKIKYHLKSIEKKDAFKKYNNYTEKTINNFNKTFENPKINKNNIKILYSIKPKKIIQTFFTKYPIPIQRKGKKDFSSKMYSIKRQNIFRENYIE